jgi:alpha/beta superfamily hydrolase
MTRLDIPTSHGRLEALWQPEPSPRALALVCHPHPLYGGTMQNTATYRIAKAWNDVGCSALRFNFRGVGGSTGLSGSGDGVPELEDALVAFDWLAAQSTGVRSSSRASASARAPRCMPLTLRHAARTRGRRAAAVGGVAGRHGQHLS